MFPALWFSVVQMVLLPVSLPSTHKTTPPGTDKSRA